MKTITGMNKEIIRQLLEYNKFLKDDLANKAAILNKINRTLECCGFGVEETRDKIARLIDKERTQTSELKELRRTIETLKSFAFNTPGLGDAEKVQLFKNQLTNK